MGTRAEAPASSYPLSWAQSIDMGLHNDFAGAGPLSSGGPPVASLPVQDTAVAVWSNVIRIGFLSLKAATRVPN